MTIKILHTSDLHLDSPLRSIALRDEDLQERVSTASRRTLERMVGFCIEEGITALLISGDLYDSAERSVKTAAFFVNQMERLNEKNIRVFYIKGNHDAENPITGEIPLPDNVHVFGGNGGKENIEGTDIWIHGVSFRGRHVSKSLLPRFHDPEPSAINIAMLHTSLAGSPDHDEYAPCSVLELKARGFDYWALGHIHKRQIYDTDPWIVMPGIPQGRNIGETGPKSATLLTIAKGAIRTGEIPTSIIEFRRSHCRIDGIEDDQALRKTLNLHLEEEFRATRSEYAILRIKLSGATHLAWQIRRDRDYWQETLEQIASETGRLWIEKIELDLDAPEKPAGASDPVVELHELMKQIAAEDGFFKAAQLEIEQILSLLPRERRMALAPDDEDQDALLRSRIDEAILTMSSRMRRTARDGET